MPTYTVTDQQNGKRLDVFVAEQLPQVSRAYIQKLSDSGKVTLNGQTVKAGSKVRQDDTVAVDYDPATLANLPELDLPILYEDDDCVVINKPAGILSHGIGAMEAEGTVASFMRNKIADMQGDRAGIVHRLDRATSGVMIGAKNQAALSWLQQQFAARKVTKTYVAVVEGTPKNDEAIVDMPITRNPKAPATFRVGAGGKPATTHYKVLDSGARYSLLQLTPQTGRTHQLRVHLQKLGHPIVGDPLYGHGHHGDRLFLHALSLEITLPNQQHRTFTAPLPPEFKAQAQQ